MREENGGIKTRRQKESRKKQNELTERQTDAGGQFIEKAKYKMSLDGLPPNNLQTQNCRRKLIKRMKNEYF